jgi:colanic acid/amylovoran biosynthesis protein
MKRKILLINQHSSNHGDEAAGNALLSSLKKDNEQFSILYNTVNEKAILDFGIRFKTILLTHTINSFEKILILLTFFIPVKFIAILYPKVLRKEYQLIKENDIIISMPGGANLGLYSDWRYLWRLFVSWKLNKKIAIYSVSIGPFKNNIFRRMTVRLLKNIDFLSLRDAQSHRIADNFKINYIKSIDTAFLTTPVVENFVLSNYVSFEKNDFVIMVANNLTGGHLTFVNYDSRKMRELYVGILKKILLTNNVVFLPQLFANGNDKDYFKELINDLPTILHQKIIIVDENTHSDIQQNIVKNAKFIVGARYHSIIFSMNNNRPFLCLSYENKMKNTLELLNYDEYGVDLTELANGVDFAGFNEKTHNILDKLLIDKRIVISNSKANLIAKKCFEHFNNEFYL